MPRRYIPRTGANRWTQDQKDLLVRLAGEGVEWPEIAQRCHHPKSSCQTMLSYIRRERRQAKGDYSKRAYGKTNSPGTPSVAPVLEPTGRTRHTSTLVTDYDLRARIAILGPNGLLGDPLPGRSALDQKLQSGTGGQS